MHKYCIKQINTVAFLHIIPNIMHNFAASLHNIPITMRSRTKRLDAIKTIISSKEIFSQEELLQELNKEGFELRQSTLSRDLKDLEVSKAANEDGKNIYVLHNTAQKRSVNTPNASEMLMNSGFLSLQFTGNLAVIRTRTGYASSMAYVIDNRECPHILGTIAGDDTIMLAISEEATHKEVRHFLSQMIPNLQ